MYFYLSLVWAYLCNPHFSMLILASLSFPPPQMKKSVIRGEWKLLRIVVTYLKISAEGKKKSR